MAKSDRTGRRKTRDQRDVRRIPELGYYYIVTDTEATERCYFNGFRNSLPNDMKSKLVIKVVQTKTKNLIEKCREVVAYAPHYGVPWIVFDRDQVKDFDKIIQQAEREGINVAWSNPCFEIWLFGYFGNIPAIYNSWDCCSRFADIYKEKTGQNYSKADEKLYEKLSRFGDEDNALKQAKLKHNICRREGKAKPSDMCPCTKVQELVGEIKSKTYRNNVDT